MNKILFNLLHPFKAKQMKLCKLGKHKWIDQTYEYQNGFWAIQNYFNICSCGYKEFSHTKINND